MKHKQTTFKNLELYNGLKAVLGFNQAMLEASYRLIEEALTTQRKPKGVHILIEQPNSQFPNLRMKLNRWAESRGLGTPLFMWCKEIRPKTKKEHCHLHIIADGLNYKDIVFLEEALKTLGQSVKCFKRTSKSLADPETGEVIKGRSKWYHNLRTELADYFERFSYISKLYSKPVKGRYWSCSNLANRQHYKEKIQATEKITQAVIHSIQHSMRSKYQAISRTTLRKSFSIVNNSKILVIK